ncbi:MAG: hypothetical protein EOP62_06280 [Sphingomonadales bacterium]|nr:MAG: hypothetical protein EOP62_06280 [Sphingomonadales bacterium]
MKRVILLAATGLGLASVSGTAVAQDRAAPWGARTAATCPQIRQAPTAATAGQLVRCAKERQSMSSGESWLVEDLQVQVGGPTSFVAMYNSVTMPDADTTKRVYPIRGSWTWSICMLRADAKIYGDPNLNCRETPVTQASGACWQTTFGDWRCQMNGTSGDTVKPKRPR